MELVEQIRTMTQEQIASAMLRLLSHVSPETFMNLTLLAPRLVESENSSAAVAAVKESLQEGEKGQATRMFRKVMTGLSPHCLKTRGRNLFINGLLRSTRLRADFERKNGFAPPFTFLISPTMQCNLQCTGCYSGRYVREHSMNQDEKALFINAATLLPASSRGGFLESAELYLHPSRVPKRQDRRIIPE